MTAWQIARAFWTVRMWDSESRPSLPASRAEVALRRVLIIQNDLPTRNRSFAFCDMQPFHLARYLGERWAHRPLLAVLIEPKTSFTYGLLVRGWTSVAREFRLACPGPRNKWKDLSTRAQHRFLKRQRRQRLPRGGFNSGRKLSTLGSHFRMWFLFLLYPEGTVLTSVTKIKFWIYCSLQGWFSKRLDGYEESTWLFKN